MSRRWSYADPAIDRGLEASNRLHASQVGPPVFLTASEVAVLLRTSRKAVYAMVERRRLPGVVRRVFVSERALLNWLRQKTTPSLER